MRRNPFADNLGLSTSPEVGMNQESNGQIHYSNGSGPSYSALNSGIKPKREVLLRAPGECVYSLPSPIRNQALAQMRMVYQEQRLVHELDQLTQRTGMPITQENGQRRYGPPLEVDDWTPPRGCEVFVGKLPRDCFEPEIVPVFEKVGRIFELRLMMDFSGSNRGYCFVQYGTRKEADRAVRELNAYEIRPGRRVGVVKSVDNCKLFIGGLPMDKSADDIRAEMDKLTEGVLRVEVTSMPGKNGIWNVHGHHGFAFVEYESHRAAALAKRKLVPGNLQLWNRNVVVDWADPS